MPFKIFTWRRLYHKLKYIIKNKFLSLIFLPKKLLLKQSSKSRKLVDTLSFFTNISCVAYIDQHFRCCALNLLVNVFQNSSENVWLSLEFWKRVKKAHLINLRTQIFFQTVTWENVFIQSSGFLFIQSSGFGLLDQLEKFQ